MDKSVGKRFNKKYFGVPAEWQTNIGQTLLRVKTQKEKQKKDVSFCKGIICIPLKRRVKRNKAKSKNCHCERAEKNCEKMLSTVFNHHLMVM